MFDITKITRENIKSLQSYKVWRDNYLAMASFIFSCEEDGYLSYPKPMGEPKLFSQLSKKIASSLSK